jgi:hypothetical protein
MATTVPALRSSAPTEGATTQKAPDERKEALGRAVQRQVSLGARVESQADYQAILVTGHRPNHLLQGILSFVTFGLRGGEHWTSVSVDEAGNTNLQKLSR